jgi:hypothetical protein
MLRGCSLDINFLLRCQILNGIDVAFDDILGVCELWFDKTAKIVFLISAPRFKEEL